MESIKYILFDLDGTLFNFDLGEKKALTDTLIKMANYHPTEEDCKWYHDMNEVCFNEFNFGIVKTRKEFHMKRFTLLKEKLNLNYDVEEVNAYYVNKLKYASELYEDAVETINYLKDKYELYIASNGMVQVQTKRMEESKIAKYFKRYFISEECDHMKPDIEFFDYVFKNIKDEDKSHYVIIGDRLDTDILGGIKAGIKTIYVNRNNINSEIKPDVEIFDLRELINIL